MSDTPVNTTNATTTAAKPATKRATKSVTKSAASVVVKKPATKKAAAKKVAAKKTSARKTAATTAPIKPATALNKTAPDKKPAKPAKAEKTKQKLVRDSFTMPAADWSLIQQLKERAVSFKRPTKKTEVLRAGLHVLAALPDAKLQAALNTLAPLKVGRPKSEAAPKAKS